MTLFSATLLSGILLIVIGALLLVSNSLIISTLKTLPRSPVATAILWGGGALWFLYVVWNISQADLVLFETNTPFIVFFGVLAVAAFYYAPDFLAVRGACVIALLAAWEILMGLFAEYDYSRRLFVTFPIYIVVVLAIYLGLVPYRVRDFMQWLFVRVQRARILGVVLAAYGVLLTAIAFTY